MDYSVGLSIDKGGDESEVLIRVEINDAEKDFTIEEAERLREVLDQMIAAAKSLSRLRY